MNSADNLEPGIFRHYLFGADTGEKYVEAERFTAALNFYYFASAEGWVLNYPADSHNFLAFIFIICAGRIRLFSG